MRLEGVESIPSPIRRPTGKGFNGIFGALAKLCKGARIAETGDVKRGITLQPCQPGFCLGNRVLARENPDSKAETGLRTNPGTDARAEASVPSPFALPVQ